MAQATIKIRIKTIREDTFELEINENASVDELKEEIKSKKGYEINRQRLIFHGKVLKPKQNLQDYSIKNGDTLHLIVSREARTDTRNDEPQPEQMRGSGNSSGQTRSQVSVHVVSANSDNVNDVLQSVLSNFNVNGPSNSSGQPSPQRSIGGPTVATESATSVFDLRRLLNPNDADTATNSDESSDLTQDIDDYVNDNDNDNDIVNRQDIDMINTSTNIQKVKQKRRETRQRERHRQRQRRRQLERQKENGPNTQSSDEQRRSNAPNALQGGLEVNEGSGFSPVGLIPPVLRTCRAMNLELDRLDTNFKQKALGVKVKSGNKDEDENEHDEKKNNSNDTTNDDTPMQSAQTSNNESNQNNQNTTSTTTTATTSNANNNNNPSRVDIQIETEIVTSSNDNLSNIISNLANQAVSAATGSTNNNNNNNNSNSNNVTSTVTTSGLNGNNRSGTGQNNMANLAAMLGNMGGLNGNSNNSGNANANPSMPMPPQQPRIHRREYLRHLIDVYERSEDMMNGNIDMTNTESKSDIERKDDESGLMNELYGEFREISNNGVMDFVAHTMNQLARFQSQIKQEYKKLNGDNDNNDNNNNNNQRPEYKESDEMKQKREKLQKMTKNAGQMLIEVGTVLGSLGHVLNGGVRLDPSNYDSRGRIRVIADQSAHVIRTAVPVGVATSFSVDSANPLIAAGLLRSLVGGANANNGNVSISAIGAQSGQAARATRAALNRARSGVRPNQQANQTSQSSQSQPAQASRIQAQEQQEQGASESENQQSERRESQTSSMEAALAAAAEQVVSGMTDDNENENESKDDTNEDGMANMLDDVLNNFDITDDNQSDDNDDVNNDNRNDNTKSKERNRKDKNKDRNDRTVERTRVQPPAQTQSQGSSQQQQQQQQQQGGFGGLLSNMMNMMSNPNAGGGGGGGGANGGLAGLMQAFANPNGANSSNANNRARNPTVLASRVISLIIGMVGMDELSSARKKNWDFLKFYRKNINVFVLKQILNDIDTPMRRYEIAKDLSIGLGNIMIGRMSNDRRQILYSITVNLFGIHLNELMNIILDSTSDKEFGKKLYDWGSKVLSEWMYKLILNFNNRENGAKQYLSHLLKNLISAWGRNNSFNRLQLIPEFVNYFVDNGRSFYLKMMQAKQNRNRGNSNRHQSRLAQNEQWALQINNENDRQRWLNAIRRDSQRLPIFINEMKECDLNATYQGGVGVEEPQQDSVLEKRNSEFDCQYAPSAPPIKKRKKSGNKMQFNDNSN